VPRRSTRRGQQRRSTPPPPSNVSRHRVCPDRKPTCPTPAKTEPPHHPTAAANDRSSPHSPPRAGRTPRPPDRSMGNGPAKPATPPHPTAACVACSSCPPRQISGERLSSPSRGGEERWWVTAYPAIDAPTS